jgi:hypothetical protein
LKLKKMVSLRKIALPVEHGGWGIVLEPAVLGVAVAPTWPGLAIAFAALLAFLARQPLKLALNDLGRRKTYPRTRPAALFALGYGAAAAALTVAAIATVGWPLLIPFAMAAPFALVQLFYDARNESRAWIAEIAGCVAMGSVAAAIGIAGGLTAAQSFTLWLLIMARSVSAVLYVRARLRLSKGQRTSIVLPVVVHAVALGIALATRSPLIIAAFTILLARAAAGLSPLRKPLTAKIIGFTEIAHGIVTVALVALAFHM